MTESELKSKEAKTDQSEKRSSSSPGDRWRAVRALFHVVFSLIWLVVLYVGVWMPLALDPQHPTPPTSTPQQPTPSPTPLGKLLIYAEDKSQVAQWDREQAIKFSMEQIDSSINYLFIAAAALLGFIVKVIFEPHISKKDSDLKSVKITPGVELMLVHAAVGCLISIVCGFGARSFFSRLGDQVSFSIYDETGLFAFAQLAAFVLAALAVVGAAFWFLRVVRKTQ